MVDLEKVLEHFYFSVELAMMADHNSRSAAAVLLDVTESESERKKYREFLSNPNINFNRLLQFARINSRNICVAMADGYLWYISNTLQAAIRRRPEILKSKENVTIEDVLNFSSRKELINFLVDRKVNSLSYGGLRQVERYFSDSLGVDLFSSDMQRDTLRVLVELRNLHAHNRGIVNNIFMERVGELEIVKDSKFRLGGDAYLSLDQLRAVGSICMQSIQDLDAKVCKKFRIERRRILTWRNRGEGNGGRPNRTAP